MKNIALFALTALASSHAYACTPVIVSGYTDFFPQPVGFEQKRESDGRIALLPAPEVKVTKITRAFSGDALCEDAGLLDIDIFWPNSSKYGIDEIGFYFRVVGGEQPDQIFPPHPVKVRWPKNNRAHLTFLWMDGAAYKKPLNLEIEVFAMNRGMEIGASQRVIVDTSGG